MIIQFSWAFAISSLVHINSLKVSDCIFNYYFLFFIDKDYDKEINRAKNFVITCPLDFYLFFVETKGEKK